MCHSKSGVSQVCWRTSQDPFRLALAACRARFSLKWTLYESYRINALVNNIRTSASLGLSANVMRKLTGQAVNELVMLAGPLHAISSISSTSFIHTKQISTRTGYNRVTTQSRDSFVTYIFFLAPFLPPFVSLLFLPTAMLNTGSERGGNDEIPRDLKRLRE